jgi:hypothetical protein
MKKVVAIWKHALKAYDNGKRQLQEKVVQCTEPAYTVIPETKLL